MVMLFRIVNQTKFTEGHMTSILVTGVGSTTGISVIKALRQQDQFATTIMGVDCNPSFNISGSSFCDRFHTIPKASEEGFISRFLEVCELENVKVLFPIIDIELTDIPADRKADIWRQQRGCLPGAECG